VLSIQRFAFGLPIAAIIMLAWPICVSAEPPTPPADDDEASRLESELNETLSIADPPSAGSTGQGGSVKDVLKGLIPQMSFILDVAGAWYSEEPIRPGAHDPSRTGFTFQQLELHAESSVDHIFELQLNLVFAEFGVEVEEAYARTLGLPGGLQVRAGQMLTRFGRLNETHPHSWSFVDQPLVNGKFFGSEGSRGLGGEVSWLAPLPWFLEVSGAMTEAGGACCARSFFGGNDFEVEGIGDFVYTVTLDQFFPLDDDWSISWGLSGQFGPNATGQDNRTEIYGSDLYLRWRPVDSTSRTAVSVQIEGMFRTRQVPGDVLQDWGLYAQLVANLTPRWEIGGRYDWVSGVAGDPLDPAEDAARHRASVQVTFYPSHFSRIRLQGNHDRPLWEGSDNGWAVILGLEFLIGAHGGHAF
jgi:hypothetical protein